MPCGVGSSSHCSAAAALPLAARAQQAKAIGFIGANLAMEQRARIEAFARRLRDLGRSQGRNLVIERPLQGRDFLLRF